MSITLDTHLTYISIDTELRTGERGTLAACSDGWYSFWTIKDGSAESDLAQHRRRNERRRYASVSPDFADIMSTLNDDIDAFESLAYAISNIKGSGYYIAPLTPNKTYGDTLTVLSNEAVRSIAFFEYHFLPCTPECGGTCSDPDWLCHTCEYGCEDCYRHWIDEISGRDFSGITVVETPEYDYLAIGTDDLEVGGLAVRAVLSLNGSLIAAEDIVHMNPTHVQVKPDWRERYTYEGILSNTGTDAVPAVRITLP